MRRLIAFLLCVSIASPSFCAWDKGFNFRATSGFVTDGANETYVIDNEAYPTVRNSVTFGWNTTTCLSVTMGGGSRDRDAGVDRRLAGIHFGSNSGGLSCTFKVDLPSAGVYTIQLGMGDAGGNAQENYITVSDNATPLITFSPLNTLATPTFGDAAGATYTSAAWPGSETAVTKTFATTTLNLQIGGTVSLGTNSTITHLFISQVSAASTSGSVTTTPGTGSISTTAGTGSITFTR